MFIHISKAIFCICSPLVTRIHKKRPRMFECHLQETSLPWNQIIKRSYSQRDPQTTRSQIDRMKNKPRPHFVNYMVTSRV